MRYFSENDFNHANPPCSIDDMDRDFLLRLDEARHISGEPFIVNSAFRSEDHELAQGRSGSSSHTKGIAVDIRVSSSRAKFNIVKALLDVGFTRMGVYKTFIHVDCDEDKENHVMW